MSADTVAVILTVLLAVGAAYVGLTRSMTAQMTAMAAQISRLGERLARVEGIIEGWLNPPPPRRPVDHKGRGSG